MCDGVYGHIGDHMIRIYGANKLNGEHHLKHSEPQSSNHF